MTTSGKRFIKYLESFVKSIKVEKLSDDEELASFDIKEMYPSLPKYDVL